MIYVLWIIDKSKWFWRKVCLHCIVLFTYLIYIILKAYIHSAWNTFFKQQQQILLLNITSKMPSFYSVIIIICHHVMRCYHRMSLESSSSSILNNWIEFIDVRLGRRDFVNAEYFENVDDGRIYYTVICHLHPVFRHFTAFQWKFEICFPSDSSKW